MATELMEVDGMTKNVKLDSGASASGLPVQITVTAEDGERGIFVPNVQSSSVMLAATVTEVRNRKAWVPVINATAIRHPNDHQQAHRQTLHVESSTRRAHDLQ
ncbi:hypothetical protein PI124_g12238 [Phytophthora idaei]|nr:hypothetical protein PI124_g12238 [Phytophthora idaei]